MVGPCDGKVDDSWFRVWLPPSLNEEYEALSRRLSLGHPKDSSPNMSESRCTVFSFAALLPGLRLSERKRLLLVAFSAPEVEIARLGEVLLEMSDSFTNVWESDDCDREGVVALTREHLRELFVYVQLLEEVKQRRREAEALAGELGEVETSESYDNTNDVFSYQGYEVDALVPALRGVSYPDVLSSD